MDSIRGAQPSDVPRLVELDREVFGQDGYGAFVLRQFIDLFGPLVGVATDGRSISGYVVGGRSLVSGAGWMLALAVVPGARRGGIGGELTAWLLDTLVRAGATECKLTVDPKNTAALSLYRRAGFLEVRREDDYFGPGQERLVLAKPLPEAITKPPLAAPTGFEPVSPP